MSNGYNKQLSVSSSKQADLAAKYFGVETEGVGTALTLGRAARAAGIETEGKSQLDVFEDLKVVYESEQIKKSFKCGIDSITPSPIQKSSVKFSDAASKFPPDMTSSTSAVMTSPIFVWKNGKAGRMTIPVHFDFEEL